MELVDFITIVSIFCDNAIEASRAKNPAIRMAYLHTGEKQLFVIENAIPQNQLLFRISLTLRLVQGRKSGWDSTM